MENPMKILNYGSMNIDKVYTVEHIIHPGETQLASGMEIFCGGKGLNQSIAIARAGGEIFHAGVIGEDGEMLADALKRNGASDAFVKRVPGASSHTVIQVDAQGQNSIIVCAGENIRILPQDVEEVLTHFHPGDLLVVQNELDNTPMIMKKAHAHGMKIVFNPSPISPALKEYPLDLISWFLLNELEGEALTGESEPQRILDQFEKRYPGSGVVLTLGKAGAYCLYQGQRYYQEAFPVKAVDTTAAGDTFTGYFVTGIAKGDDIPCAMRLAAKAASITVGRKGAADSIPTPKELE